MGALPGGRARWVPPTPPRLALRSERSPDALRQRRRNHVERAVEATRSRRRWGERGRPRMTRNPIYDYPDPYANPRHGARPSPRKISLVGRLRLTQPVWFQLGINSATALHILQREPPGTFLVRRSNTRQCHVLCLRLPDNSSPAFVTTYCLRQEPTAISLEGSELTFPSLLHLIAAYCSMPDILPLPLRLPRPIWEASSCQHLEAIAHLGLEFWNSALNSKVLYRPALPGGLPRADTDPPPDAPMAAQSREELALEKPARTADLPKPSCGREPLRDVGARRQRFKNSVKVRVSTEAASPLSPPAAPPPPIPVGKKKKNLSRLPQPPASGAGGQPASQHPRAPSPTPGSYHTPCCQKMPTEDSLGPPAMPPLASAQMLCVAEEEERQPKVWDKAVRDCSLASGEPA
ncbi:hypothetical protein lerEdw1_007353 [Lerista edwardsae]|nr:hypothetical protein lerEdw1_007353 [Lerista edwardsae]